MAYRDLDFNLTDEQKALRDTIRKFGAEVMRPAGEKLDKLADPQDVIAKGSALWDVFRTYREVGLHRRSLPKALGGMQEDMDPMSNLIIGEEMGYADAGLTISLGAARNAFFLCGLVPPSETSGNWPGPMRKILRASSSAAGPSPNRTTAGTGHWARRTRSAVLRFGAFSKETSILSMVKRRPGSAMGPSPPMLFFMSGCNPRKG